jgi:hypothetical protein
VKGWGREVVEPSVAGGEDRPGDGRISVRAVEVPSELMEGMLPDRCHLGSRATSDVLRGFIGAGAARALGHVPGHDLVHLMIDAAEAGGMFDLEPVGNREVEWDACFWCYQLIIDASPAPKHCFCCQYARVQGTAVPTRSLPGGARFATVRPRPPRTAARTGGSVPVGVKRLVHCGLFRS